MTAGTNSRLRLGLLLPSCNTTMEPDFYRHLPAGITLHTARMYLEESTVAAEERMLDEFASPAARDVATAKPHAVVFGCTSGGALRGNAYDLKLCQDITRISGVPTVSVMASVREAIQRREAKRIAVITPYVEELNQCVQASIEAEGVEVLGVHGMGIVQAFRIAQVTPQEIVAFAQKKLKGVRADLLFASCTNWRGMEAIPLLRELFDIPVISSNQAALEAALRTLGATT